MGIYDDLSLKDWPWIQESEMGGFSSRNLGFHRPKTWFMRMEISTNQQFSGIYCHGM